MHAQAALLKIVDRLKGVKNKATPVGKKNRALLSASTSNNAIQRKCGLKVTDKISLGAECEK